MQTPMTRMSFCARYSKHRSNSMIGKRRACLELVLSKSQRCRILALSHWSKCSWIEGMRALINMTPSCTNRDPSRRLLVVKQLAYSFNSPQTIWTYQIQLGKNYGLPKRFKLNRISFKEWKRIMMMALHHADSLQPLTMSSTIWMRSLSLKTNNKCPRWYQWRLQSKHPNRRRRKKSKS